MILRKPKWILCNIYLLVLPRLEELFCKNDCDKVWNATSTSCKYTTSWLLSSTNSSTKPTSTTTEIHMYNEECLWHERLVRKERDFRIQVCMCECWVCVVWREKERDDNESDVAIEASRTLWFLVVRQAAVCTRLSVVRCMAPVCAITC